MAAKRFGDTLAGTLTLTAGLGGMGGAQPLAVTMNGGVALCIDCDASRIRRRIEQGYLDEEARTSTTPFVAALTRCASVAPVGGAAGQRRRPVPELLRRGAPVDVVTDQTSRALPAVLPAVRGRLRGHGHAARGGPRRVHGAGTGVHGRPRRGDGGLPGRRRRGLRLDAATSGGTKLKTSQLALPEDTVKVAYASDGYSSSVSNLSQVSLATDGVFGDGWSTELATVKGSIADGFTATLNVPV